MDMPAGRRTTPSLQGPPISLTLQRYWRSRRFRLSTPIDGTGTARAVLVYKVVTRPYLGFGLCSEAPLLVVRPLLEKSSQLFGRRYPEDRPFARKGRRMEICWKSMHLTQQDYCY